MRFGRRPDRGEPPIPISPGERLVRRTGAGLAVFTLALIAILLAAVGLVTAAAAVQVTDASLDANLRAEAQSMLEALAPTPTPTPTPTPEETETPEPTPTASPTRTPRTTDDNSGPGGGDDNSGPGGGDDSGGSDNSGPGGGGVRLNAVLAVVAASAVPTAPAPTAVPSTPPSVAPTTAPAPAPTEEPGTFSLVVDTAGTVVSNPQNVPLVGLPDQAAVSAALAGREDWRTVTANGVPVRLLTEPMLDLDGAIIGALQSGVDLTAHREQQALIVRTIVIASLVGLLGAALVTLFVTRRAMRPIRAAFDSERRFVAAASHELRTPVAVVRASAEILQREDLVQPDGRKLVEDIVAESDRLARLVGDLLALASAEAGQITVRPSVFDARALVDEAVDRVTEVARARGVDVEAVQGGAQLAETAATAHAASDAELLVRADRERMMQLLTIFIDNAIEHSPPNGVVRVVARPVMDSRSPRVALEVMDQGPGVPFAERDRIFEPFARVAGRSRRTGSTGLGLAIARILAARQNAALTVRDAPGGGACFSVSLARRAPASEPQAS